MTNEVKAITEAIRELEKSIAKINALCADIETDRETETMIFDALERLEQAKLDFHCMLP